MFLEPHCTFQPFWLEPLISRIIFNDQYRNAREQLDEEEKGVGGVREGEVALAEYSIKPLNDAKFIVAAPVLDVIPEEKA